MKTNTIVFWLLLALALPSDAAEIPDRPEKLTFPKLTYEPPNGAEYRVPLKSGPVAFVVPNRELPLVSISILGRRSPIVDAKTLVDAHRPAMAPGRE